MRREPFIKRFNPDESGRVLDRKRVGQVYLHLLRILLPLSAMAAAALFAWGLGKWEAIGIIVLFGIGVLLFIATCFYECFFIGFYPTRCCLRWLRERIDRRSEAMVKSDDPDAYFVQIIPRKNWTDAVGENAIDVGLLVVDRRRDELRYEGDMERWMVPAESVRSFDLHSFKSPGPRGTINEIAVVVLVVALDNGKTQEIPLACQPIHLEFWTPYKSERGAELLRRAIGNLVDPGHWPPVPEEELWPLRPPKARPEAIDYGEPTEYR